jgi:polyisoprenoid-binding protein YceI
MESVHAGCTSSSPRCCDFRLLRQPSRVVPLALDRRSGADANHLCHRCGWLAANHWQVHHFQGKIAIDFDNPHASNVSFKVAANSVDAGSSSFNDFLRGAPFFNVANYPYISFVSTRVEKADARHAHVAGNLTMLGVTRPINLNVDVDRKLAGPGQRVGFKATGTIDRREFGMYSGYPIISETVHLTVTTEVVGEP